MIRHASIFLMEIAITFGAHQCRAQGYTITTLAGGGNAVVQPISVAVDAAGNAYIPQASGFVSKVSPSGAVSTVAGSPTRGTGFSGDGGPAINAQFKFSGFNSGAAIDSSGNLYIADTGNFRVRRISPAGIITTIAGGGTPGATPGDISLGDGGLATAAVLLSPAGLAVDSADNLYIADAGGSFSRVRKVTTDGKITTVAGCLVLAGCLSLGDGGPATSAMLSSPSGVAVDSAGNVYIADTLNNRIRKVSTNGIITTVAGSAAGSYQGDGGPATSAGLLQPWGIAVDAAGNLIIDDTGNYRIRMVSPGGTITTIAGNGAQRQIGDPSGDGGPATSASLGSITTAVALGPQGAIYFADPIFGLRLLTLPAGSPASISGVVSASAFGQFPSISSGTWIEIYGSSLAAGTRGWAGSDFTGVNAPTSLDGTTVSIGGQAAFIDYISPGQVNAQVPSGIGTGSQPVLVRTANGLSSPYMVMVNSEQPGLLAPSSFNIAGKQYAAALFSDGTTYVLPAGTSINVPFRPAHAGDTITLYGVGFGSVTPNIPPGQIVQQTNSLALQLQVLFAGAGGRVVFAGLAPGVVGLYQINVVLPNIPASNTVPLTFNLGGTPGTQTLYVAVQ